MSVIQNKISIFNSSRLVEFSTKGRSSIQKNTALINSGFTLIEFLAIMIVIGTVSAVIASVFFIFVRGGKKSDLLIVIRQNGNFALSEMDRNIRYAKSLNSPVSCIPSVTTSSLGITSVSTNTQTTYSCPVTPVGAITANGASLTDSNTVSVTACSFTCSQKSINDPPDITISFTLSAKSTSSLVETNASIPFQTSVVLRNYYK